jgi:hypothetical protein
MRYFPPSTPGNNVLARLLSGALLSVMPPPPPLPPPTPLRPPPPQGQRDFLIGLGVGAIPLLVAMIGLGGLINVSRAGGDSTLFGYVLGAGGVLWVIGFIVMIVFTIIQRLRRIGLGMLTSLVASPVIFFIGCVALYLTPTQ